MKANKLFLLNFKKTLLIIVSFLIFVILHNLVSVVLGFEEALFFILAVFVLPLYFLISIIVTIINWARKSGKKKKARIVGLLIILAYAILFREGSSSKILIFSTEFVSGVSVVAIAFLMAPLFKKHGEKLSLAYFWGRLMEGIMMIVAGFFYLLNNSVLLQIREGIYAVHAYIFALSALLFYVLLYKSGLVSKFLSIWGLMASILLALANILQQVNVESGLLMLLFLPIILNELVLAIWLIAKGFRVKQAGN
jgi:hypothetical protein